MRQTSIQSVRPTLTHQAEAMLQRQRMLGKLYSIHNLEVCDVHGRRAGSVHRIWPDEQSGRHEFIGINLHPVLGSARAVPAIDMEIDPATSTIRVPYTREQICSAPRISIARPLTVQQKHVICAHYGLDASRLPTLGEASAA